MLLAQCLNKIDDKKDLVSSARCLMHARQRYLKAKTSFPKKIPEEARKSKNFISRSANSKISNTLLRPNNSEELRITPLKRSTQRLAKYSSRNIDFWKNARPDTFQFERQAEKSRRKRLPKLNKLDQFSDRIKRKSEISVSSSMMPSRSGFGFGDFGMIAADKSNSDKEVKPSEKAWKVSKK